MKTPKEWLDLGANAENTAHHLHQYAILGSFYAENVRGIKQPRVGLLNNGTEALPYFRQKERERFWLRDFSLLVVSRILIVQV